MTWTTEKRHRRPNNDTNGPTTTQRTGPRMQRWVPYPACVGEDFSPTRTSTGCKIQYYCKLIVKKFTITLAILLK